ncbi:MAG: malate dehydrogenase, partial [Deltaproteobacteria bacterium]|nr:malate dehydrogenase [Deltaproteobacteria bacterium]
MRKKISIIGAGNVGMSAALGCLNRRLGDIVLIDINENIIKGKAMDVAQSFALEGHGLNIFASSDYADTAGSYLIIITAGIARKHGMSRDDLLKTNADIVFQAVKKSAALSPGAIFIITSNPVDILCMVALRAGDIPAHRIVGLSGVLDTARMRAELGALAHVSPEIVQGLVIGEHGNTMVPLTRLATIGGVPASSLLSKEELALAREHTINGGAKIVELMGFSAFYAPGTCLAIMADAFSRDVQTIMPCSTYLDGQYGAKKLYIGAPVRIS